ncbi:MAG TPA: PhnD/SsuA/transferrin family substrate-binding protein, partial [Kofleriaceae bacterium]|nr:PhnD/SsuA/transferrin family substrate-binding protein [Kofleriaceae bacterium]
MTRVASLPMYDPPGLGEATDALWAAIAAACRAEGMSGVPGALDRTRPLREVWQDPDLLLSQTCGYPLVHGLAGVVRVVATPRYAVPACAGTSYTSHCIVPRERGAVRLDDLRGALAAANQIDSHSGMNAFRALIAPLAAGGRFFAGVVWSGSHRASLELVARGEVDVAAIDCVTFALLERLRPDLTGAVRIIASSEPCPAPPLVTAAATFDDEVAALRRALARVAADPSLAQVRASLLLDGFDVLPEN